MGTEFCYKLLVDLVDLVGEHGLIHQPPRRRRGKAKAKAEARAERLGDAIQKSSTTSEVMGFLSLKNTIYQGKNRSQVMLDFWKSVCLVAPERTLN